MQRVDQIFQAKVPPHKNSRTLHWKEDMLDIPVSPHFLILHASYQWRKKVLLIIFALFYIISVTTIMLPTTLYRGAHLTVHRHPALGDHCRKERGQTILRAAPGNKS